MGAESSKSNSNSLESDSESFSNSADEYNDLETMDCSPQNSGTIIRRVWISKKSITLNDRNVQCTSV